MTTQQPPPKVSERAAEPRADPRLNTPDQPDAEPPNAVFSWTHYASTRLLQFELANFSTVTLRSIVPKR